MIIGDKADPKLKDYEKSAMSQGDPKAPKLKDYEKDAVEENTTKQRKQNKRYKDYEAKDGDGGNDKKDM
jgi:hypothetical protein